MAYAEHESRSHPPVHKRCDLWRLRADWLSGRASFGGVLSPQRRVHQSTSIIECKMNKFKNGYLDRYFLDRQDLLARMREAAGMNYPVTAMMLLTREALKSSPLNSSTSSPI